MTTLDGYALCDLIFTPYIPLIITRTIWTQSISEETIDILLDNYIDCNALIKPLIKQIDYASLASDIFKRTYFISDYTINIILDK